MALLKPLKLRSEKVAVKLHPATQDPVATVLVNTGVFHLEEEFSYVIPHSLADSVTVGSLVRIPFGRKMTEGVLLSRGAGSIAGLKFIDNLLGTQPVVTSKQIQSFRNIARRYGVKVWDVFRLAVPTFSKAGDKACTSVSTERVEKREVTGRFARTIHQSESIQDAIDSTVTNLGIQGKILVIFPDEKSLSRSSTGDEILLSSDLTGSKRYSRYLMANALKEGRVFGTRSAVFIDAGKDDLLVIVNDADENHYERHSPQFNSRDVALLRCADTNVLFLSYSHSLEVARLAASGWLTVLDTGFHERARTVLTEEQEVRTPYSVIGEGLKRGSVLVVHANSGYVNSFSCNKCKNIALCSCGGRQLLLSRGAGVRCSICERSDTDWSCRFCSHRVPRSLSMGVERRAEDYGKSFPQTRIVYSSGTSPVVDVPNERCLVICTPGMEPAGEYAAVVLLDGAQIFSRTDLRADEVGLLRWSGAASHLIEGGILYLSLPNHHPVSQSFIRGRFDSFYASQIEERTSAHLPPLFRVAIIHGENSVLLQLKSLMLEEFSSSGLLGFTRDFVDGKKSGASSNDRLPSGLSLLLQFPIAIGDDVIHRLFEVNRVRSLQALPLLKISIDPYNFS
ncbi:MAG: hypothetical protein RL414_1121 [Actinomycetota bacterium]